ncbi:hypothetical protein Trydic_g23703 [Trypoxylus dichotomus]
MMTSNTQEEDEKFHAGISQLNLILMSNWKRKTRRETDLRVYVTVYEGGTRKKKLRDGNTTYVCHLFPKVTTRKPVKITTRLAPTHLAKIEKFLRTLHLKFDPDASGAATKDRLLRNGDRMQWQDRTSRNDP